MLVSEKRLDGIDWFKQQSSPPDVIILDDAFQHRRIKGHLNVLLSTFDNPYFSDWVVPTGTLRDSPYEKRRADIIVFTKCPNSLTEREMGNLASRCKLSSKQSIFFSNIESQGFRMGFDSADRPAPSTCVIVSAIANGQQFENQIRRQSKVLNHIKFADHHRFSLADIQKILDNIDSFATESPALVTTEKDMMRLAAFEEQFRPIEVLYQPIQFKLLRHEDEFKQKIFSVFRSA